MNKLPALYNADTDEFEPLPYKWEICGCCNGEGKTSAHLGAFTQDELNEDPDFAEDYFAGFYDRACDACDGSGKIAVADEARMTSKQRTAWLDEIEAEARFQSEVAHERRQLGCGY